jgi:hypothetical protein
LRGLTYPKRFKIPKLSTIIPVTGHLMKTRKIPKTKHAVPGKGKI